jgi:hypothetical protein
MLCRHQKVTSSTASGTASTSPRTHNHTQTTAGWEEEAFAAAARRLRIMGPEITEQYIRHTAEEARPLPPSQTLDQILRRPEIMGLAQQHSHIRHTVEEPRPLPPSQTLDQILRRPEIMGLVQQQSRISRTVEEARLLPPSQTLYQVLRRPEIMGLVQQQSRLQHCSLQVCPVHLTPSPA